MPAQSAVATNDTAGVIRTISIPAIALLIAVVLINTRLLAPNPSSESPNIFLDDSWNKLQRGLRTLSIVFGLSCAPGILAGTLAGFALAQNSILASASLRLLRVWQWSPFLIWWVLIALLFFAFDQSASRYSYIWLISVPSVALGTSYHYLLAALGLSRNWPLAASEAIRVGVLRTLFITVFLTLSIWNESFLILTTNENKLRFYITFAVLAIFLAVINRTYQSGLEDAGELRRDYFLKEISQQDKTLFWLALLIGFFTASL